MTLLMYRLLPLLLILSALAPSVWGQTKTHAEQLLTDYQQARAGLAAEPVKCGFPALAALHAERTKNPDWQPQLRAAFARPTLPNSYVTPDGRFKIHYTTTGFDAVNPASTNAAGVPDFIYEAGRAAQRAYALLVEELGMRPHANDNGSDGPEFDFYVLDLGNLYGETILEFSSGSGPSYIRIDNDYGSNFYTRGLEGLRVTVAHEYFHAVQLNYFFRDVDIFFFELSATWFEDVAYDDINDYYQYLRTWFRNPDLPLNSTTNFHQYGSCIWLHYLTKRLEPALVRLIWNQIINRPAVFAMQNVLDAGIYPMTFAQGMQEFSSWNYFTRYRADANLFYEEGEAYPTVAIAATQKTSSDTTIESSLEPLAAHYYQFVRQGRSMQIYLHVDADPGRWAVTAISGSPSAGYDLMKDQGLAAVNLPALLREDTVTVAITNVGAPPSANQSPSYDYQLQIKYGVQQDLPSVLENPRPNPFRIGEGAVLVFPYRLAERERVHATIYREDGKVVREFNLGSRGAGFHSDLTWNGTDGSGERVSSGVYFMRLRAGDLLETTKVVVIAH